MGEWWQELTSLNRLFYGIAMFFSVFFVWQLLAILLGMDFGDADATDGIDADTPGVDLHAADGAHMDDDAFASTAAFNLISLRSVIMFCTLFSWGMALYLNKGLSPTRSLTYSTGWGVAGMLTVAILFCLLQRLSVSGTSNLNTCVGQVATVYLAIPKDGVGQVRTTVSGVVSYVKARAVGGGALKAGAQARVVQRLDQNIVEVEPIE